MAVEVRAAMTGSWGSSSYREGQSLGAVRPDGVHDAPTAAAAQPQRAMRKPRPHAPRPLRAAFVSTPAIATRARVCRQIAQPRAEPADAADAAAAAVAGCCRCRARCHGEGPTDSNTPQLPKWASRRRRTSRSAGRAARSRRATRPPWAAL
eukprot:366251-Chlamydomonas_euryale.AAC.5